MFSAGRGVVAVVVVAVVVHLHSPLTFECERAGIG